jgi:transposase
MRSPIIGTNSLIAIADRGYFKGEEILACEQAGITALVPATKTSNAKADGRFDKADFVYDRESNAYRCPAGQSLIWRFASVERGMTLNRYWSSNCKGCLLKEHCTPSQQRKVTRWEHQDVLDDMQVRLEQSDNAMRIRRCTVEHPFGTIKSWMGATHFLSKGLERVKTEMSLHVLAYNLKRLMTLLGIAEVMKAIRAHALLLALWRVFEAIALLTTSIRPENRSRHRNARLIRSTAAIGYSWATVSCICVFTQPGPIAASLGPSRLNELRSPDLDAAVWPDSG